MRGISSGGVVGDPSDGEMRRYPVLVIGIERSVSRMLVAICHAIGYHANAAVTTLDGLDYLARHREPHVLILSAQTSAADDPGALRYLKGNPTLRHRLAVIVYGGFDPTPQRVLTPRQQRLVDAWLTFPPNFEAMQESMGAACAALSQRLSDQRDRHA